MCFLSFFFFTLFLFSYFLSVCVRSSAITASCLECSLECTVLCSRRRCVRGRHTALQSTRTASLLMLHSLRRPHRARKRRMRSRQRQILCKRIEDEETMEYTLNKKSGCENFSVSLKCLQRRDCSRLQRVIIKTAFVLFYFSLFFFILYIFCII